MVVKLPAPFSLRKDLLIAGTSAASGVVHWWAGGSPFVAGVMVTNAVWFVVVGALLRQRHREALKRLAEKEEQHRRWLVVYQAALNLTPAELTSTWKN